MTGTKAGGRIPEGFRRLLGVIVPEDYTVSPKGSEFREQPYRFLVWLGRRIIAFQGSDIVVEGAENYPTHGGAVIAANHTGYFDPVYVMVPGFLQGYRKVRYMGKAELFDIPVFGRVFTACRQIPVDRFAGADAFARGIDAVRKGALLGVFPEATISRSFELKDFKTGAARIAAAADAPIIPVTVFGSQRVATKGLRRRLGREHIPVWIRVGKPIAPSDDAKETTARLRADMQQMLDDVKSRYSDTYGPLPTGAAWVPATLGGGAPTREVADEMDELEREQKRLAREEKIARQERKRRNR